MTIHDVETNCPHCIPSVREETLVAAPCFTCPRCSRTSHHPIDAAAGYCAKCHAFTRPVRGLARPEPWRLGTSPTDTIIADPEIL
jgi:hypothetical protein